MEDTNHQETDPLRKLADLVEDSKRVYTETQNELQELEVLLQQTLGELEKLDKRTVQVANRLRHIESNLNSYPREDIRDAYSASQTAQLRLVMLRSQTEQLQAKKEILERQADSLHSFLELAIQIPGLSGPAAGVDRPPMQSDSVAMRIIEAQEGERQRLARQMHDGPAQSLTNLILQAEIVERSFGQGLEPARAELSNLKKAVNATFQKTMDFVFELSPMMLYDLGVVPTLRRYIEDFEDKLGLEVTFDLVGEECRLAPYVEITVFRVIQELLRNVGQHAHASHVQVTLNLRDSTVGIVVEDDGSGFDVEQTLASLEERKTLGLATIQRRLEMLGGDIQMESSLGRGTKVTIEIPAG